MTKFQITNVQIRNDRGSFLKSAGDFEVFAQRDDIEHVSAAVAKKIGNNYASFSWEAA